MSKMTVKGNKKDYNYNKITVLLSDDQLEACEKARLDLNEKTMLGLTRPQFVKTIFLKWLAGRCGEDFFTKRFEEVK